MQIEKLIAKSNPRQIKEVVVVASNAKATHKKTACLHPAS